MGDSIFSSFNFLRLLKCHSLIRVFFFILPGVAPVYFTSTLRCFLPTCRSILSSRRALRVWGILYTRIASFYRAKNSTVDWGVFFAWRMPFSGKTLKNLALSNSQSDHWTQSVSPIYAVCKEVICRRENDCENNQVQKLYCTWTLRNLFTYILTRTCLCIYALLLCRKCNSAILSFVVF